MTETRAFADLHLHSCFSDGTFTPEEVAENGARCGFSALALTDHDTVEGCPRMRAACERLGIQFLPGVELTSEIGDHEVHILGYEMDLGQARFLESMGRFQDVRQKRIVEMIARLNALGIPLREESVYSVAQCRSPGRPHVARALVQQGLCGSLDEAFERFLKKHRPAWVPKFKMSTGDAIRLVHNAGGVAVMAHPGLTRADEVIPTLVAEGLDGIECLHSKHSGPMSERYMALAAQYGLAASGGSDCHGRSKGKPLIGSVILPFDNAMELRSRAMARRQANAAGAASASLGGVVAAETEAAHS